MIRTPGVEAVHESATDPAGRDRAGPGDQIQGCDHACPGRAGVTLAGPPGHHLLADELRRPRPGDRADDPRVNWIRYVGQDRVARALPGEQRFLRGEPA